MKSNYIKYVLGGISAIILGALGSGAWEIVLKPVSIAIIDGIVNNTAFIFKSLKDSLYLSIAKGYKEEPSLYSISLLLVFFWAILGGFIGKISKSQSFIYKNINGELAEITKQFNDIEHQVSLDNPKILELRKRLSLIENKLRRMGKIFVFIFLLLISFLSAQYFILSYKNNAITNYNQSLTIIRPYITIDECNLLDSRFAQIKNEYDYYRILDHIALIAKKNNLILP